MFRGTGIDLSTRPIIEQMQQLNLGSSSIGRLSIIDIQKTNVKRVIRIDQHDEYPRWDSLSGPPVDRLLFHLRNDEDCEDLNNFAMVSPYFRNEAKHFTKGAENRPGIEKLILRPSFRVSGGVEVQILLFRSNIPFYDFTDLDWKRFDRIKRFNNPALRVILSDPQDPAIEQLASLLSSTIQSVEISHAILNCFTVAAQLLRNSKLVHFDCSGFSIDDSTIPILLGIASNFKPRSNKLEVWFPNKAGLSDPESFITAILKDVTSLLLNDYNPPFYDLPNSFWEKYLNAKLSSGSVGWIEVGWNGKITKAPINIDPNSQITRVKWGQATDI